MKEITKTMNNILIAKIEAMPPGRKKIVLELRERYKAIMQMNASDAHELARKAIFANYISGVGRRLIPDFKRFALTDDGGRIVMHDSRSFFMYSDEKIL